MASWLILLLSACSETDAMTAPSISEVAVSVESVGDEHSPEPDGAVDDEHSPEPDASVDDEHSPEADGAVGDENCFTVTDDSDTDRGDLSFYDEISKDFLGDFTIVAYCWDNYNYLESIGPLSKGDEINPTNMEGCIDPASCIGYHVSYTSSDEGYDAYLSLNNMTAIFTVTDSDGGYGIYERRYADVPNAATVLNRHVNLAISLDLSEKYMRHWSDNGDLYTFGLAWDAFPELTMDSDMRRNIEYVVKSFLILDENHLLLAPGIWNLLAVRDTHLDEGCNYLSIQGSDLVFSR